jgi:hypothetical protein
MSKKLRRPYTLILGIFLILFGVVYFTDSWNYEDLLKEPQFFFSIAGIVFILFAFAKN